ncbi:Universal stress protein family protein [Aquimixticola soesokkakensis]|uniref:Universal stress protein family protein n=1 Tax=Aquimixticola soesokkakensis TaxID=1519096 RepID=A0A1Y5SSZ2_9RHOB|nr:universal stress protein [Aquimixticola soesokkakensis]SLN47817.1 Universal stress protein family protein [Aquimixticola soesokkakensis]
MAYKTLTTIICDPEQDQHALGAAIALARRFEAHLDVLCLGIDRTQPGTFYAGANAMILQNTLQQARAEALDIEAAMRAQLEKSDISWATVAITTQIAGLTSQLAHALRFCDLTVLARPYGAGRGHEHEQILEAALFAGKIPVLVIPEGVDLPDSFARITVAWNESSEAMTAIRAALPVLSCATNVDITLIDPPQHSPDRSDPGGALSQMLARHGVCVEVSVLAKTMPRVSDVLSRHLRDSAADLLVMGAYGHSRFRESILGGATRHMLETATGPVLMAH